MEAGTMTDRDTQAGRADGLHQALLESRQR